MQVSFVSGIGCVANANITEVILLSRRPGGSNLNYVWMDDYDDKILKVSCYGLIIKNMVTLDQAYSLIKKVKVNYLSFQFDGDELDPGMIEKTNITKKDDLRSLMDPGGNHGYYILNRDGIPINCPELLNLVLRQKKK